MAGTPPVLASGPIHPILFAAWIVMAQYVSVLTHPLDVVRTFAVAIVGATLLTTLVWMVLRHPHRAGLAASAVIGAVAAKPFVSSLSELAISRPAIVWGLVVAAVAVVALGVRILRLRGVGSLEVSRVLNVFAVAGLVVVGGQAVVGMMSAPAPLARLPRVDGDFPDIYLIVPDAYPGQPTLDRVYGSSNEPFLDDLEGRGFRVDRESHSNYWFTSMTLASMLNMEPVTDIDRALPMLEGQAPIHPGWRHLISDNEAFALLRSRGYEIAATASGWSELALRGADYFIDTGQLNDFELALWRGTYAGDVLDFAFPGYVMGQHRERVEATIDAIGSYASASADRPRFLLAHLPIPHRPFAYSSDGSPLPWTDSERFHGRTPAEMGIPEAEYRAMFAGQVEHLNDELIRVVDTIRAESRKPPVILIVSDHGPGNPAAADDYSALLRNLTATYLPDGAAMPDGTTPVNVLTNVFNEYLDAELQVASNEAFAVGMIIGPGGELKGVSDIAHLPREIWMHSQ